MMLKRWFMRVFFNRVPAMCVSEIRVRGEWLPVTTTVFHIKAGRVLKSYLLEADIYTEIFDYEVEEVKHERIWVKK